MLHMWSACFTNFLHTLQKTSPQNVDRALLLSQQGNELVTFLADKNLLAQALPSNRSNGLVYRKTLVISKIPKTIAAFAHCHRLTVIIISITGRAHSSAKMTFFVSVRLLARGTVIAGFEKTTHVCNQIKVMLIQKKTDLLHVVAFCVLETFGLPS